MGDIEENLGESMTARDSLGVTAVNHHLDGPLALLLSDLWTTREDRASSGRKGAITP